MDNSSNEDIEDIAVVGMSGRFPGAHSHRMLWHNVKSGTESISHFSVEDALTAGAYSDDVQQDNYVRAGGVLKDIDKFDAEFFGYSDRESQVLDPQHRIFLECAWEALEQAGYCVLNDNMPLIGIFASSSMSTYFVENLLNNKEVLNSVGRMTVELGNNKDFMPSRIAYKLNLRGPCIAVQNGCTSSLTALYIATQHLLSYQCDMAVVGGSSIRTNVNRGYLYQPGGILSPDGHCKVFDKTANGTVEGNGTGVIVLKRLSEAIQDRDAIHAIIKGIAINNDGSQKPGFAAPSFNGQVEAIKNAYEIAGINPDTISFVETQGTGTIVGDYLEVSALSEVFKRYTSRKNYCALGSIKANIGHLDVASGMASLIKSIFILKDKVIPPVINYNEPNPQLDLCNSPFYINKEFGDLSDSLYPMRVAINSFGAGGTNLHVILEEAPKNYSRGNTLLCNTNHEYELILVSARTKEQLCLVIRQLLIFIKSNPNIDIADLAYTLNSRREHLKNRIAFISHSVQQIIDFFELVLENSEVGIRKIVMPDESNLCQTTSIQKLKHLEQIADEWISGLPLRWIDTGGKNIELPTYHFEKKSFWVDLVSKTENYNNVSRDIKIENGIEQNQFLSLLKDISGSNDIELSTKFLDLRISSLMMVQLLSKIRELWGIELSIDTFNKNISVEELYLKVKQVYFCANKIGQQLTTDQINSSTSSLNLLNKNETQIRDTKLVCVPPLNGVSYEYNKEKFGELSKLLDETVEFYCIQHQDDGCKSDMVFSDKTDQFYKSIINSLTNDSYILCGWCNGGIFAMDVANKLIKNSKNVQYLILLDTYEPRYASSVHFEHFGKSSDAINEDEISFVQSFLIQMDPENKSFKSPKIIAELRETKRDCVVDYIFSKLSYTKNMTRKFVQDVYQRYYDLFNKAQIKNEVIFKTHVPSEYNGDVILIRAIGSNLLEVDKYLGWRDVCKGKIYVHDVEATHISMLTSPDVNDVSKIILNYIS